MEGRGLLPFPDVGFQFLVALDAKTGRRIPTFGDDGVVDLKVGWRTVSGRVHSGEYIAFALPG